MKEKRYVYTPSQGYLLCCIERTGSNLLAETLLLTGVAGRPWEYFNPVEQSKARMQEILGDLSIVDGFDKVLAAGSSPNEVFSAKVHWNHFRYLGLMVSGAWDESKRTLMYELMRSRLPELLSEAETEELLAPLFADLAPHATAYKFVSSRLPALDFIWLRRRNMVARAISLYRARRTNLWRRPASPSDDTTQQEASCAFDLSEIHIWNRIGGFQEKLWQKFFDMHQLRPHIVYYEDLVARHEETARGVMENLGLPHKKLTMQMPQCLKQSGEESSHWEERYRESGL